LKPETKHLSWYLSPAFYEIPKKKAVSPVRVTAWFRPVVLPSSEPMYSGKDGNINN
jgi:hypothetical protein